MRLPLLLGLFLALAATGVRADDVTGAAGAERLAPFKRELQRALQDGLQQGPVEAIAACRVRAPEIAAALEGDGVRVGRASHRLRNPANAAPDWVRPVLEDYLARPADRAPRTLDLGGGRLGYVEPILVQPLCLTCHGEALPADVAARIEALYPEDRAVGFRVDELRGVFWLEFPAVE